MSSTHVALFALLLLLAPACKSDKPAPGPASPASGSGSATTVPATTRDAVGVEPTVAETRVTYDGVVEPTPEAIHALHKEMVGGVTLGMTEREVIKSLGVPTKKTTPTIEEKLNGEKEYFMRWTWRGIQAVFGSASKSGRFTLRSIKFSAPSKAKTARGIGVGSTRTEVAKAYANIADPVFAKDPRFFIAGLDTPLGLNGISFDYNKKTQFDDQRPDDRVTFFEAAGGAWD